MENDLFEFMYMVEKQVQKKKKDFFFVVVVVV